MQSALSVPEHLEKSPRLYLLWKIIDCYASFIWQALQKPLYTLKKIQNKTRILAENIEYLEISPNMMSIAERDVYVGELALYTYYDRFPNDVPTAASVFDDLRQLWNKKKLGAIPYRSKKISLREIDLSDTGYAKLLFWSIDPEIPDPDYAHKKTGARRTATRNQDEDPVLSAHVLIDINGRHDIGRRYPMAIEDVDNLPRSLIIDFFNRAFADHFSEERVKKGTNKKSTFSPRSKFEAPYSHTLDGVLSNGGVLKSVKWVEKSKPSTTFGDATYPVEKTKDVVLSIKNKPTGNTAANMVRSIYSATKKKKLKKITVSIDDEFSNPKTLQLDIRRNDVLSSFFLKRITLKGFSTPLGLSADTFRNDMLGKMKKVL